MGRNHDPQFIEHLCEVHHRQVHELLRQRGLSLEVETDSQKSIATRLRALAVQRRMLANAEADAMERWADTLDGGKTTNE